MWIFDSEAQKSEFKNNFMSGLIISQQFEVNMLKGQDDDTSEVCNKALKQQPHTLGEV